MALYCNTQTLALQTAEPDLDVWNNHAVLY